MSLTPEDLEALKTQLLAKGVKVDSISLEDDDKITVHKEDGEKEQFLIVGRDAKLPVRYDNFDWHSTAIEPSIMPKHDKYVPTPKPMILPKRTQREKQALRREKNRMKKMRRKGK